MIKKSKNTMKKATSTKRITIKKSSLTGKFTDKATVSKLKKEYGKAIKKLSRR